MTVAMAGEGARPLVTVVLRIWVEAPARQPTDLRLQATHVQSGDVEYFRTIQGLARHIEQLIELAANPPIDFSIALGRSKKQ